MSTAASCSSWRFPPPLSPSEKPCWGPLLDSTLPALRSAGLGLQRGLRQVFISREFTCIKLIAVLRVIRIVCSFALVLSPGLCVGRLGGSLLPRLSYCLQRGHQLLVNHPLHCLTLWLMRFSFLCVYSYSKLGYYQNEDLAVSGVVLMQNHLETALDSLHSSHSDAIGAPKVGWHNYRQYVTWSRINNLHRKIDVHLSSDISYDKQLFLASETRSNS